MSKLEKIIDILSILSVLYIIAGLWFGYLKHPTMGIILLIFVVLMKCWDLYDWYCFGDEDDEDED